MQWKAAKRNTKSKQGALSLHSATTSCLWDQDTLAVILIVELSVG